MTWEYGGDPSASAKDEVRFLLGDTDESDPQMQDEEIDYLVAKHGDPTLAALAGARALASRYAREVTKAVGDLRIELSDRSKNYRDLAKALEATGGSTLRPVPWAGGISVADKEEAELDTDRVEPAFEVGQDDFDRSSRRDDPAWGIG